MLFKKSMKLLLMFFYDAPNTQCLLLSLAASIFEMASYNDELTRWLDFGM